MLEPIDDSVFWMVFNPARKWKHPPRKQYRKLSEAMRDAKGLSETYPGQKFYILQCIGLEAVPAPAATKSPELVTAE